MMKITRRQLRKIINEEISRAVTEEWSSDVESKWDPPEGLFTRSAEEIVRALKRAPGGMKKAMSRLNFYINRGGDDVPNKTQLEKAKRMLMKKESDD